MEVKKVTDKMVDMAAETYLSYGYHTPEHMRGVLESYKALAGVGNDTAEVFIATTHLLYVEARLGQGASIPWEMFVRGAINYLGHFLCWRIRLTPRYYQSERPTSTWHVQVVANLLALVEQTWPGKRRVAELG